MFASVNFPCPKCGSTKTKLRNTNPNNVLAGKLLSDLTELAAVFKSKLPGGRKWIVCNDCGYVGMVMLN